MRNDKNTSAGKVRPHLHPLTSTRRKSSNLSSGDAPQAAKATRHQSSNLKDRLQTARERRREEQGTRDEDRPEAPPTTAPAASEQRPRGTGTPTSPRLASEWPSRDSPPQPYSRPREVLQEGSHPFLRECIPSFPAGLYPFLQCPLEPPDGKVPRRECSQTLI
jgi:hypothetical protein